MQKQFEVDFAIAHFEMLAIIIGLKTLESEISSKTKLLLRTDSIHVLSVLKNKNASDDFLQSCLRWLCMFAVQKDVSLYVIYVNTKINTIADAGSRFDMQTMLSLMKKECKRAGWCLKDWSKNYSIPDIHQW